MSRAIITITDAIVSLGTVPLDFSCQVNSAAVVPTANNLDVPATFCEGASQTAAPSSFALDLVVLQAWGLLDSVCQYLFDHDGESDVAFHLEGIAVAGSTVEVDGFCSIVAAQLGGEAATPLTSEASLPILGKPTIVSTPPVAADTAAEPVEEQEPNTFQPAGR